MMVGRIQNQCGGADERYRDCCVVARRDHPITNARVGWSGWSGWSRRTIKPSHIYLRTCLDTGCYISQVRYLECPGVYDKSRRTALESRAIYVRCRIIIYYLTRVKMGPYIRSLSRDVIPAPQDHPPPRVPSLHSSRACSCSCSCVSLPACAALAAVFSPSWDRLRFIDK